jgi:hypothetical protein
MNLLKCCAVAVAALSVWPYNAEAQTAPESMRNKSYIVSWTENRSLRVVGEGDFRDMATPFSVSMYVSSAGRPFTRISATPNRRTGSAESIGTSGRSFSGGARQIRFSGNSIEFLMTMRSGGGRRVSIDTSGGGCSARVITAMQVGGGGVIRSKSLASGKAIEIRSVQVSGTNCSTRQGNVFGN